jgi:hypothetical protein
MPLASQWTIVGEKLGGNADDCENKGFAKKATQKCLEIKEMQIDG